MTGEKSVRLLSDDALDLLVSVAAELGAHPRRADYHLPHSPEDLYFLRMAAASLQGLAEYYRVAWGDTHNRARTVRKYADLLLVGDPDREHCELPYADLASLALEAGRIGAPPLADVPFSLEREAERRTPVQDSLLKNRT